MPLTYIAQPGPFRFFFSVPVFSAENLVSELVLGTTDAFDRHSRNGIHGLNPRFAMPFPHSPPCGHHDQELSAFIGKRTQN
jgi:hypothetical protein